MEDFPGPLTDWIDDHHGYCSNPQSTTLVDGKEQKYILTTVKLEDLEFTNHRYNPRVPTIERVKDLQASITRLGLLSPLTCAYLNKQALENEEDKKECVILIDGRHRFNALKELAVVDAGWGKIARVDVKIFYNLTKSDLHVLATYLNRTRQSLKKGEYYRAIVNIFDEKLNELQRVKGDPAKENEIFDSINTSELSNRNIDLSIGRIVGLTAFNSEEQDSWYQLVGEHQFSKYTNSEGEQFYSPLTAGNLAEFLKSICYPGPYDDYGDKRDVEIGNVVELGRKFRKNVLIKPVKGKSEINGTTVASKYWCMSAFGSLLSEMKGLSEKNGPSLLSDPDIKWSEMERALIVYSRIMEEQAEKIRRYKDSNDPEFLKLAWSHQTIRDNVKNPMKELFEREHFEFSDKGG